jgi:hypothetical protein
MTANLVGGHLRAPGLARQGSDEHGVAGELGGQGNALPVVSAVSSVQQDGGLAHYPALLAIERDGVEPIVEACMNMKYMRGMRSHGKTTGLRSACHLRSLKLRLSSYSD